MDRDAPARACGRWTSTSRKLGLDVHFANREELRTEISAKFTRERLEADLRAAGLVLDQFLTDDDELFALSLIGAGANSLITAS